MRSARPHLWLVEAPQAPAGRAPARRRHQPGGLRGNVEWRVLGFPVRRPMLSYGCCSELYHDVTTLLLRRRAAACVYNLLLPCVLSSHLAALAARFPPGPLTRARAGAYLLPVAAGRERVTGQERAVHREVLHGHHDYGQFLNSTEHPYYEHALLWSQCPPTASLGLALLLGHLAKGLCVRE
ncbi:Neuronal acetylcholine receptor subunit alpha-10 [Heterocephalus glaber]|uniref:Neuronal acetylcholine receptor subunit alpha-10 n=1 Tax=Heterocephalus glaber TaxID=10181 RepID=G5BHE2_HETGA|nr:Neuronal acetylcholine receptor subunit alpha-10 [Heterocephalus glaber]